MLPGTHPSLTGFLGPRALAVANVTLGPTANGGPACVTRERGGRPPRRGIALHPHLLRLSDAPIDRTQLDSLSYGDGRTSISRNDVLPATAMNCSLGAPVMAVQGSSSVPGCQMYFGNALEATSSRTAWPSPNRYPANPISTST